MTELDFLDLTTLTDEERATCADPPSMGDLCRIARVRSDQNLRPLADDVGVSHVTVLAWERRSDDRLILFWKDRGYKFPTNSVNTTVVLIGKSRVLMLNMPVVDHGVVAEWSGMKLVRRTVMVNHLDEHEYAVDEERGVYRFSKLLHGRRSIAVSYSLR